MTAMVLQQNRLRWYWHVLPKEDDDWVKKCMEYDVEGPRPKRTWKEVVKEDCQARKLNKEDAMDRMGECLLWYQPTWVVPDQRPLNGCVCV